MFVAITFVTTIREQLVRGPRSANCDSPVVESRNNHYESSAVCDSRSERWRKHDRGNFEPTCSADAIGVIAVKFGAEEQRCRSPFK